MRKGREKENQRLFLIKLTLWSQKTQLVTQSYGISSDKVNTFPASQNSLCGEEKATNLYANFFIFPFIDQRSPNRTIYSTTQSGCALHLGKPKLLFSHGI